MKKIKKSIFTILILISVNNSKSIDISDLYKFSTENNIPITELTALTCDGNTVSAEKFNKIEIALQSGTIDKETLIQKAKTYINQYKLSNIKAGDEMKGRKVIAIHKDIDSKNFAQLATIGAGDCGFDSLYISRDDAIILLKQKVNSGESCVIEALSSEATPIPREESEEQKKARIINFLNNVLSNASAGGGRGMLLIESNIDNNGNIITGAGGGSLCALARAQNKKLIVYTPNYDGKLIKLFEDANPPENASPAYVHITKGGGHYTILEEIKDPQYPI